MADSFGQSLRQLRQARGISLDQMALLTLSSPSQVSNIEAGRRSASVDFAKKADEALGATPLLETLLGIEEDTNDMRRRALIGTATSALGVAVATGGLVGLGEVLRQGLQEDMAAPEDWQTRLDDLERRLVLDPSELYGRSLTVQLILAREAAHRRRDPLDIAALGKLSLLYGLYMGNSGQLPEALGWYRTASAVTERSGDPEAQSWALGRAASRGSYEGMPAVEVRDNAERALAVMTKPTAGAVEARSALIHLHALNGDLAAGHDELREMWKLAEQLPDTPLLGPHQRAVNFHVYLEGRAGTLAETQRAFKVAERELAQIPLWLADASLYMALAMVRAGDTEGGIEFALRALKAVRFRVHTLALGAADVLRCAPSGYRSDNAFLLRGYAASGSGPWETLQIRPGSNLA